MADPQSPTEGGSDFTFVFEREKKRLYQLAYAVLLDRQAAETAIRATMLDAWKQWYRMRDPAKRSTALSRICLEHCIHPKNERAAVQTSQLGTAFEDLGSTHRTRAGRLALGTGEEPSDVDLDRAYHQLPTRQRAALLLHLHGGHSIEQCAELLGCRVSAMRNDIERAITQLRADLAGDQPQASSGNGAGRDDAIKRRLQLYLADIEPESVPPGVERLHMPADAKQPTWTSRFLVPVIAVTVAVIVIIVIVLVVLPDRGDKVETGGTPLPTAAPTVTSASTSSASTSSTIPQTVVTATLPTPTSTSSTTPPTTGNVSTTLPVTTSTRPGQLFADDFAGDTVGNPPFGWSIDSGTWTVIADAMGRPTGKALQGSSTRGSEGRIANGSPSWTDVTVSVAVRRDGDSIAGLAARYQNASNYYFCKIDGGQLGVGVTKDGKSAFLAGGQAPLSIPVGQVVTMTLTVRAGSLQCSIGTTSVSGTDASFGTGRMALLQDGPATFANVLVARA